MKNLIKDCYVYLEVIWAKFMLLFNVRKSEEPIPKGTLYCYEYDEERNKKEPTNGYWIKPCKYYRNLGKEKSACTFVGYVGDDVLLIDQCKICGIGED